MLIHGEDWDDDRKHLRRAHELAQRPEISGCAYILRVLDLIDDFNTYLISEAAQTTLDAVLRDGPLESSELHEVEVALRGAIDVLHRLGLVHCDVREDNIFRVSDRWKLGDLGGAVEVGSPIVALPKDREYVPEGVQLGCAAKAEYDLYALDVVLNHARNGRAQAG
jgi:serine/threonine protein kinase